MLVSELITGNLYYIVDREGLYKLEDKCEYEETLYFRSEITKERELISYKNKHRVNVNNHGLIENIDVNWIPCVDIKKLNIAIGDEVLYRDKVYIIEEIDNSDNTIKLRGNGWKNMYHLKYKTQSIINNDIEGFQIVSI